MAAVPNKPLGGFRLVQIRQGDTLQAIAARALNDASRWTDLISINRLTYPYLTGDPTVASASVLLYGAFITVPASVQAPIASDPNDSFGTDIALDENGDFIIENGDLAAVSGVANLSQALSNRINTELRELMFHLAYGCGVRKTLGQGNGPTTGLLGAQYVATACEADPRVSSVDSADVTVTGDVTAIVATVEPVVGAPVRINMSMI